MELTFKTPVQIFINDKWFCTANEVNISEKKLDPKQGVTPKTFTGTIINIKKEIPREKEEVAKNKKTLKGVESYDEFFSRMVKAVDDPSVHIPVDVDIGQRKGTI